MAAIWNWLMAASVPGSGRASPRGGAEGFVRESTEANEQQAFGQAALVFRNGGKALQLFGVTMPVEAALVQ